VACRAAADAMFWQIARIGARDVMDFAPMMGFFGAGRLQVRIAQPDGAGCETSPAASPLLSDAFAATPADPVSHPAPSGCAMRTCNRPAPKKPIIGAKSITSRAPIRAICQNIASAAARQATGSRKSTPPVAAA
ncbi:hypothetical protein QM306_37415, partial [Burkholderia cenocepacia]|nr:hypothetical protein [Burkholderia cenocepacia]